MWNKQTKRNVVVLLTAMMVASCTPVFAYSILWDTSHGVVPHHEFNVDFSQLISNLNSNGFTVDTSTNGLLVDDPFAYDLIVVSLNHAWENIYAPEEVDLITEYVNSGGGLLLMGDNTNTPNQNIQPIASEFGITLGVSFVQPNDLYLSDFAPHTIFDGISHIYMRAAGEISSVAPSAEIAWQTGNDNALIAATTYGAGRFLTFGDCGHLANNYIDQADNMQFSINTFEYLAIPEPTSMLLLAIGSIMIRKNRETKKFRR